MIKTIQSNIKTIQMNKETFISKYKPYYLNDFCMNEKTMNILRTLLEIDDLKLLFIVIKVSIK